MIKRETLVLLRIPFSVFFLPVFLFAWSQSESVHSWERVLLLFVLLHLLVYPLISGIENYRSARENQTPLPKGFKGVLLVLTLLIFALAFFVSPLFQLQLLLFITCSLAAFRQVPAMLWKMLLRGAFIYWLVQSGIDETPSMDSILEQPWAKVAASAMMATLYLTGKIFSRSMGVPGSEQDKQYSPVFPGITALLLVMNLCLWMHPGTRQTLLFLLFQFFMLPVYGFLFYWYKQVRLSTRAASFDLSMRMSLLLVLSLGFYFLCVGIAL